MSYNFSVNAITVVSESPEVSIHEKDKREDATEHTVLFYPKPTNKSAHELLFEAIVGWSKHGIRREVQLPFLNNSLRVAPLLEALISSVSPHA